MAFGFLKTKPVEVTPTGQAPSMKDMSWQEKLMALSFILRDDPASAMQIPMLAQARQQQAQRQNLMGKFAQALDGGPVEFLPPKPKAEAIPAPEADAIPSLTSRLQESGGLDGVPQFARGRVDTSVPDVPRIAPRTGGPVSMRTVAPTLMEMARTPGMDIGPFVDIVKGIEPEYDYVNGMRVDKRDPNAPAEIFEVGEGQRRVFDDAGRPIGVMNAQGYVQSVAELEGAKTAAQEGAKAGFDMVEVNVGGQKVQLPRSVALPLITQAFAQQSGGALPEGFGTTQSKAEETADVDTAKAQVELDFMRPKAESALAAMEAKNAVVDNAIDRALGLVGGATAGFGSALAGIPGTPARDLQAALETIKANLGFDELQTMRDNSPTGGALGQVAVQELEALRSTLSSLDQAQSPEALAESLRRVKEIRAGSLERRRDAFRRTFERQGGRGGAQARGGGTRTPTITPEQARAELARRRAERGGQ